MCELIIIWDTGEKDVIKVKDIQSAEKAERNYKMAFGKQIAWTGIVEKRGAKIWDTFILSETPSFSEDKSLERINVFLIGSVVQWFSIYKQYPIFRLSTSII